MQTPRRAELDRIVFRDTDEPGQMGSLLVTGGTPGKISRAVTIAHRQPAAFDRAECRG